jgi:Type ISP C-terminal specificity domain
MLAGGCGDLLSAIGPEDIAAYIYALLSAPPYRERYAEPLREDFPRVFVSSSPDLARNLIEIGHQLIQFHLLEGEISSNCRLVGEGPRLVESVGFLEVSEQGEERFGRIAINRAQAFEPVAREVWEFEVGRFQVCRKWLAERRGRHLSADDVESYRRMIAALAATLNLMDRLEDIVDESGGLPFGRQPVTFRA